LINPQRTPNNPYRLNQELPSHSFPPSFPKEERKEKKKNQKNKKKQKKKSGE